MDRLDVAVIGGGVIGLAIARALAEAGREVLLIEAEPAIGAHTSSRNSEVIHAGIYYPKGSLKAELCVRGKGLLYDYCERAGVEHRRLGKLIVASREEELPALDQILKKAEQNGVRDLGWVDQNELRELEPEVTAVRGLFSPSTGIIDSHGLMAALRRDATRAGATVLLSTPVVGGSVEDSGIVLRTGGADATEVMFTNVVNAAGLGAQAVARSLSGMPPEHVPESHYAKGHYFVLAGRSPFRRLVYPVPEPGGLGVHVTLDLAGQARFGPDVSWVNGVDYAFDESRADAFYAAIRRYFPRLPDGALSPGYTGIRPKLGPSTAPAADFVIQGPKQHGVPGLVNLYGIESPGLTASLAIAENVRALLADHPAQ
jgi:L-2-hydroxyglutarate oxidase LhgO